MRRETLQRICDQWNAKHPAGTVVNYHATIGGPPTTRTTTRGPAFVLSDHTPCVFIEGRAGAVALAAIEPAACYLCNGAGAYRNGDDESIKCQCLQQEAAPCIP